MAIRLLYTSQTSLGSGLIRATAKHDSSRSTLEMQETCTFARCCVLLVFLGSPLVGRACIQTYLRPGLCIRAGTLDPCRCARNPLIPKDTKPVRNGYKLASMIAGTEE
jgi:hypothetical protein